MDEVSKRKFTAQEMREAAIVADTVEVADQFYGQEMDKIAAMLRQAADDLEREEKREKKYEYAERCPDGFVPPLHTDKGVVNKYIADGCVLVRREVGEWEEVKDEN